MKASWLLEGNDGRIRQLTLRHGDGRPMCVRPVLTAREVCRRLGKSRRQVYRYVRAQQLQPCARVLGQWLFSEDELQHLRRGGVPGFLRQVFWDVRLSDLSLSRHQDFILTRILEFGDRAALRWLFAAYPRKELVGFLQGRSAERLSRRAWNFWRLVLELPPATPRRVSWRLRGRAWGGVTP